MGRKTVLLIYLIATVLHLWKGYTAVIDVTTVVEDSNFVNQTVVGDVPTVYNVTSAIMCFFSCLNLKGCKTIFYNQKLSTCTPCPQPCTYNVTWSPGYRCFRSEKTPMCPHPTDVMWAEPTLTVGYYGDNVTYRCLPGASQNGTGTGLRTCDGKMQWVLAKGATNPVCNDTFRIGDWIRIKRTSAATPHMAGKSVIQGAIGIVTNTTSPNLQLSFPWAGCGLTPSDKLERVPDTHPLMKTACNSTLKCSAYPNTVCHFSRCVCSRYFIYSDVEGRCV
ncbi:uncharacterized protein LOC112557546 [Pomacea canaliculata]|uniref:uncharacterized protein LOC112557546 n=1 Tax=Pomacea canaliculata TaxID=400727 RepID=UPI000D729876|nr:uncharacterized protein LOC112557546 [Pomacea canaliculata]